MTARLGERLVSNGVITNNQLQEALRAQTIFGGRLGTNLVELGYISERDLSNQLGLQHHVPYAQAYEFEDVKGDAIMAIPADLAQKYRVFPLGIQNRTVRLATTDPSDFGALDDISFATGLKLIPVVAPEVLIIYALEKYYEIPRSMRYIRLSKETLNRIYEPELSPSSILSPSPSQAPNLLFHTSRLLTLKKAVNSLANLGSFGEWLEVFERYVSEDFNHVALFEVREGRLIGITQIGCKMPNDVFCKFSSPCSNHRLFKDTCQSKKTFAGVPPTSSDDEWLMEILGFPKQERIFCMPIVVGDGVSYIMLAAEAKDRELLEVASSYFVFAQKLSLGLEYLAVRSKILDLSESA